MPKAHETPAASLSTTVPCAACHRWNRVSAARMADGPKCGSCGAPLHLDRPILLTDQTFDRVVRDSTLPVLVDFYADWCGPCRAMAPAVDALAKSSAGQMIVAKLDTDASQQTAGRFQIRGIPTVIAFRDGREISRESGVMSLAELRALVR